MTTQEVINDLVKFRDDRGWQEFHTLIGLSRALGIAASEVEKVFLWKKSDDDLSVEDKSALKLEIADVLTYAFYMCEKLNVDPNQIVEEKLAKNKQRHWKFEKK